MCGHVGMAGELDGKTDKAMKMLLIFDSVRGEDSTGVASVSKFMSDVIVAKTLGNPFNLFESRAYERAVTQRGNRAIIGHNRYATSGAVNRMNAHPFEFETLVGAHNGTLTNKHELADANEFKVDSENLFHHIEKHGVEDAIRKARGAWALVWWDKVNDTINFLRNDERPLYYTVNEAGTQLFWASEMWMLRTVLARADIKYKDIEEFEQDYLHTVPVAKGGKLGKPLLRKLERAAPRPVLVYPSFPQAGTVRGTESSNSQPKDQPNTAVAARKEVDARSKLDAGFLRTREVEFEAVCEVKDPNGGTFILCFCPEHPFYEVRLYVHRSNEVHKNMGCVFTADVQHFMQTASNQVGYYKLSPHSVKITEYPDETQSVGEYPDHNGKYLGKAAWEKEYGVCAFCTTSIQADDINEGARLTTMGDALCKSCVEDTELIRYVNFV